VLEGDVTLNSNWEAATLALTHIGTLGFLGMAMLGLVYRVAPSVAKAPLPGPRLPYAVYALLVLGIVTLTWSLRGNARWAVYTSLSALALMLVMFVSPVAWSQRRAWPATGATFLLQALASFLLVGMLGLWMVHGHAGMPFPGPRGLWVQVHLSVGLLGWLGALLPALTWHFVPASGPGTAREERNARITLALLATGVLLPVAILGLEMVGLFSSDLTSANRLAALGALPAAVAVCAVQPLQASRSLYRLSPDDTVSSAPFLMTGFALAPVAGIAGLIAVFTGRDSWRLLLGWLAIWGWAGMLAHGLLLHASLLPPLRRAWSLASRMSFGLHVASLIVGAAAIMTGIPWVTRCVGLLLVATALSLARCLAQSPQRI
jgi:hypothetical protein